MLRPGIVYQYFQLVTSAPLGAVFRILSIILGAWICTYCNREIQIGFA